jgi:hypothetical protein
MYVLIILPSSLLSVLPSPPPPLTAFLYKIEQEEKGIDNRGVFITDINVIILAISELREGLVPSVEILI